MSAPASVLTPRLRLEPVNEAHLDELHELYADPRGWEHAPAGRHTAREQTERVVQAAVQQWRRDGLAYWVAFDRATGRLVGTGGARRDLDGGWNLYWQVHADARGHGYAVELARAAFDAARSIDPAASVRARMRPEHDASRAVAERIGLIVGPQVVDPDGVIRVHFRAAAAPHGRAARVETAWQGQRVSLKLDIEEVRPDSSTAQSALAQYFRDIVGRYFGRTATHRDVEEALRDLPSDHLVDPTGVLMLAWSHGLLVGCAGLSWAGPEEAELTRVWVSERFRRRGAASRLITDAEDRARAHGCQRISLEVRADLVEAQALYRAHGYEQTTPFSDGRLAEAVFSKHL